MSRCVHSLISLIAIYVMSLLAPALGFAQRPQVVKSRITSVGLFKNGLAVVEREVALPGPGVFALEDVPEPVHGTFWIECSSPVDMRVTTREEKRPLDGSAAAQLQTDLVGQRVHITFRDNQLPPLEGTVVDNQTGRERDWRRDFESWDYRRHWWGGLSTSTQSKTSDSLRFLLLQTELGLTYVDESLIGLMSVQFSASAKRQVPVIELTVSGSGASPGKPSTSTNAVTARVSYLAKGLSWAPAYRIELGSDDKLELRQQAVVRNEMEDLDGAEVLLITGFPSIEFSHVLSPLSAGTNWAEFFTQLNQRPRTENQFTGQVMSQMHTYSEPGSSGIDTSRAHVGDGIDLHYHSLGARQLNEGDSLLVKVAAASAMFERYVEWRVPDTRDANGRHIDSNEWQWSQRPELLDDDPWDAVRFKNPLDYPLTTGPAMILNNDRFGGQHTLKWVAPAEETSLRINKALSIRTRAVEVEEAGEREVIRNAGRTYRRPIVNGELFIVNHREEAVQLRVRRQFSGELVTADADPTTTLREEGVYSVNPRHELTWNITLAPGERRTLKYVYTVLVPA